MRHKSSNHTYDEGSDSCVTQRECIYACSREAAEQEQQLRQIKLYCLWDTANISLPMMKVAAVVWPEGKAYVLRMSDGLMRAKCVFN